MARVILLRPFPPRSRTTLLRAVIAKWYKNHPPSTRPAGTLPTQPYLPKVGPRLVYSNYSNEEHTQ